MRNDFAYRLGKRLYDVAAAFVALLLLFPLILVIAVLVAFSSKGGCIFKQERVGKNGRLFTLYKFRTMSFDNSPPNVLVTAKDDPRITYIGRYLRHFKLDELPQLVNVLRGDMSLVGPRPEVERYVKLWPEEERSLILSVAPGLTDLATLSLINEECILASAINKEEYYTRILMPYKIRLSSQYVKQKSFYLDFYILYMTFLGIVWQKKAPTDVGA